MAIRVYSEKKNRRRIQSVSVIMLKCVKGIAISTEYATNAVVTPVLAAALRTKPIVYLVP
jgi:hypothetical protein